MKTVFVSGAEGFVGKQVVLQLLDQGFAVVGGVRNRARKLAFEKKYGRALVCDVSDAINVARVIASTKPDGVIHLAGESLPHHASSDPLSAYQSIVTAWANVLDAVRRSTPRARIVLTSSSEIYGNAGADGQPIREDAVPQPVSPFGSLKLAAESIAQTYFSNYHLNLSIARPFQIVGQGLPSGSFFGTFAQQVAEWDASQGNTIAWPDLDCRRDVLSVRDAAAGYLRILTEGEPSAIYNVSSGTTRTVGEICNELIRASGAAVSVTALPPEETPAVACYCGDNSRLQALGWTPQDNPAFALAELMTSLKTATQPA